MIPLRLAFLLASLLFTVSTIFANGHPFLKDAGEFSSSLFHAGIAHPTGFPGQHVLAGLAAGLPFGSWSFRLSLLSAASLSVCLVCAFSIIVGFLTAMAKEGRQGLSGRQFFLAGACAFSVGLWCLASDVVWFHALNVEVYLPSLAMTSVLLALAAASLEEGPGGRWWRLFALAGGVASGFHITCVGIFGVLGLILVLKFIFDSQGRRFTVLKNLVLQGAIFWMAGAVVVLYLPVRAATNPVRNWGNPSGVVALLNHLTGQSIRTSFQSSMLPSSTTVMLSNAQMYLEQIWHQTATLLPLAVAGVVVLARWRWTFLSLLLGTLLFDALFCVLINPMGMVEKQTGTISIYVLALLAAAGVAGLMIRYMGAFRHRMVAQVVTVLLLLAGGLSSATSLTPEARMARIGGHGYNMVLGGFRATGPGGVLAVTTDDLSALAIYFAEVEQRRPDLLVTIRQMVCSSSYLRNAVARVSDGHEGARIITNSARLHCPTGGRAAMVKTWDSAFSELRKFRVSLGYQLGEAAVDGIFASCLEPGYPLFSDNWDCPWSKGSQVNVTTAFQFEVVRGASGLSSDFSDDISALVLSEYYRLAGTWFLTRAGRQVPQEESCALLTGAIEIAPWNCRAWNNAMLCYAQSGSVGTAIEMGQRGSGLCPRYSHLQVNYVRYLLLDGRLEQGRAVLSEFLCHGNGGDEDVRIRLERLYGQLVDIGLSEAAIIVKDALRLR
jgi:hypothetical protein